MLAPETRDMRAIRAIVVDSSQIHGELLADGIRRDSRLQASSVTASADFLEAATRHQVDVGVISSTLDEPGDGFDVLRSFRSLCPTLPAVMLLESSKREMVVKAFRGGARGVLGRQTSLADLCKCIHCVHQGEVWASASEVLYALDVLASSPSVSAVDHRGMSLLTQRETEVVSCLVEGLTNREIGERLGLSRHTVKNYLFRIFDKIGVSSRMELLSLTLRQPAAARNSPPHRDSESEIEICQKHAEEGSAQAQIRLAELLQCNGQGTSKDYIAAYMWSVRSERAIVDLRERVSMVKARLLRVMTADEILKARQRASEWSKNSGEHSSTFLDEPAASQDEVTTAT